MADDVSCGIKVSELSDQWKHGPEFMPSPDEEWPQEAPTPEKHLEEVISQSVARSR